MMKFLKEIERNEPLYCAKLENNVTINVYHGYAIGSDSKTYYFVGRENSGHTEHLGWSSEINAPFMLDKDFEK